MAEPIHTRPLPKRGDPWIVAVSRSHLDSRTEAFIAARPGAIREVLGSAVKFGRVAEGGADIYPRLAPTCEWDVAAGHAVVTAAGGKITDAQGADLAIRRGRQGLKGQQGFIVPEFIAWGDPAAARADFQSATAPDPAPAPASAGWLPAGSARDRRQRRPGLPRGRTDKAAVPRSSQNQGLPATVTPRARSIGS